MFVVAQAYQQKVCFCIVYCLLEWLYLEVQAALLFILSYGVARSRSGADNMAVDFPFLLHLRTELKRFRELTAGVNGQGQSGRLERRADLHPKVEQSS